MLAATHWHAMPHLAIALARLVDRDCEARVLEKLAADLAGSPLLVDELRAMADLDLSANIVAADVAYPRPTRADQSTVDGLRWLSGLPRYALFARTGLTQAAERVSQLHTFERPYAADKAFTLKESAVVARLARVALDRDEPWVPEVLGTLFRKVSLAPKAAKTVPSQSVSRALGHAVEAFPTPEALAILRDVLENVRHAGVARKLQRNVRGAERGLASRPEIALRLAMDQPMSKQQLGTLARCLEAGFGTAMELPFEDLRIRLALHPQARKLAGALVWRIHDGAGRSTAVLPVARTDCLVLHDVRGAVVAAGAEHRVTLWHPSDAGAEERDAWRDRVVASRLAQPFKQVFREHYAVAADERAGGETSIFSGHTVSMRPFVGLARREGWSLEYDHFARTIGAFMVTLHLNHLVYPGVFGWATLRSIRVGTAGSRRYVPARFGDLPAVALSEVLRSVDLLVSTSGFALASVDASAPDDPHRAEHLRNLAERPLGPMAEMRRDALERVLTGRDGMEELQFDDRHLRLGAYAIHLATGRVTCDGDPVRIEMPDRAQVVAVPWLPYDERLLEIIAVTTLQIGQRRTR